ncbi:hypothetical protein Q673_06330 [Marinobacter sp. EN3]|uniref:hypothetical protein n=1 Tax=Marinobacter sp. EN3 TaxID=1397533 RepID=UPI0003B8A3BD|nr:hypothetical protein [Marinobacter sp. EN3]ERS04827.1 hypothetical protein Q673_06330 [Marinobacter sp. EN3]
MDPQQALTIKDYWDIGIGVSGVFLTLIAVAIAIWIPAWQRGIEMKEKMNLRNSQHTAIFAWIRNDLDGLERTVEERVKNDPDQFGDINMSFDGLDHFRIKEPNTIKELRNSPGLMVLCPNSVLKLIWNLGELDLDIETMKSKPEELEESTYADLHEYYVSMHYENLLLDLTDIYHASHKLGLDVGQSEYRGSAS